MILEVGDRAYRFRRYVRHVATPLSVEVWDLWSLLVSFVASTGYACCDERWWCMLLCRAVTERSTSAASNRESTATECGDHSENIDSTR